MAGILKRMKWEIPEREATPEDVYFNRRKFLRAAGITGIGAAGLLAGCGHERVFEPFEQEPITVGEGAQDDGTTDSSNTNDEVDRPLYPAQVNPKFEELDRTLTDEMVAASYNNFYEFSTGKTGIAKLAENFVANPWQLEIKGLVGKPGVLDIDKLIRRMPLEEQLYRHRCVEAWSMALPWTGFQMKALLDEVEPLSSATHLEMTTFINPEQAPGQFNNPQWPWPYVEGLRIEEAMNELAFLATGVYGHELPRQHGAPIRLVVPWKYGFKGLKSIASIEFTDRQPSTFWNTLVPREYGFIANVEPDVPHPRWSQATERFITSDAGNPVRRPTLPYNGYEEFVSHLYG
jgi:sulfoxide reductase catalytic subunit YedY